jgi:hypothetical protein
MYFFLFKALSSIIYTIPAKDLPVPHQVITDLLLGPLFRERFLRRVTIKDALFGLRLNAFYNLILWIVENLLKIKLPPEIQIKDGTADYAYAPLLNVKLAFLRIVKIYESFLFRKMGQTLTAFGKSIAG